MIDEVFRKIEAQFNVRPSTRKPSAPRGVAMLAKTYCGQPPASYAVEPKVDGVRVIVTADLDKGLVTFASRRGNPLRSLDHLAQEVLDLFGSFRGVWILDCEAVAGKGFFDDVGEIRSESPALDAQLWVFDIPSMRASTYRERRKMLSDIFEAALPKPCSLSLVQSLVGVLPE